MCVYVRFQFILLSYFIIEFYYCTYNFEIS